MNRFDRITEIVKGHLPMEVLREFLIELDNFDTEAKREILDYRSFDPTCTIKD